MRAALAALYWAAGEEAKAEDTWGWACSKINSGQLVEGGPVLDSCERYADSDWLERIRRWPPIMVCSHTLTALPSKPARTDACPTFQAHHMSLPAGLALKEVSRSVLT